MALPSSQVVIHQDRKSSLRGAGNISAADVPPMMPAQLNAGDIQERLNAVAHDAEDLRRRAKQRILHHPTAEPRALSDCLLLRRRFLRFLKGRQPDPLQQRFQQELRQGQEMRDQQEDQHEDQQKDHQEDQLQQQEKENLQQLLLLLNRRLHQPGPMFHFVPEEEEDIEPEDFREQLLKALQRLFDQHDQRPPLRELLSFWEGHEEGVRSRAEKRRLHY